MARLQCFVIPDQLQHVIVRDNNRDAIFIVDDDYQFYLDKRKQATNKAWLLGSNHFKNKIEQQLNWRTRQSSEGGDRKSKAYHEKVKINRI